MAQRKAYREYSSFSLHACLCVYFEEPYPKHTLNIVFSKKNSPKKSGGGGGGGGGWHDEVLVQTQPPDMIIPAIASCNKSSKLFWKTLNSRRSHPLFLKERADSVVST